MTFCDMGYPPCGGCEGCIGAQIAYYEMKQRENDKAATEEERVALTDAYFHGLLTEPIYQPTHEGSDTHHE